MFLHYLALYDIILGRQARWRDRPASEPARQPVSEQGSGRTQTEERGTVIVIIIIIIIDINVIMMSHHNLVLLLIIIIMWAVSQGRQAARPAGRPAQRIGAHDVTDDSVLMHGSSILAAHETCISSFG